MSESADPPGGWSRPDPQRLIASFPFAVVLVGPDRMIAATNPAAEQIFGQSARRVLGKHIDSQLAFAESQVASRLGESEAQLFARDSEVRIAGQLRRLDVMFAPVAGHPGWQMVILHESIGADALGSERHGGDAAPLRAPDVLAHEIKNPLAGIRGAAQLLARTDDSRQRELTTLITSEVDRVTLLIDQMQTLSRKGTTPQIAFNVHEALRRALQVLATSGVSMPRVEEEFDPSLPPALCSPDALVQIVLNLIANAREACAEVASPQIRVRTRFASGLRLHGGVGQSPLPLPIEIRVSDNGPGIDPELGNHIFEPFVSSKPHGQGLGLALVQKLVREMNGRITHDRDPATGLTHFRLHLPVAEQGVGARRIAAA